LARALYVAATEPRSGKSLVTLGVMELLAARARRVGFFRPVVASDRGLENDMDLIAGRYGLVPGETAVYAFTNDDAQERLTKVGYAEVLKDILARYKAVEEQCDLVVCEGTDFTGVSTAFEFDFNAAVAQNLGCAILPVINGHGRDERQLGNAILAARQTYTARGCRVLATVVNRAGTPEPADLRARLAAAVGGHEPLFVIPEEPALGWPTMADVARALGAELIHGTEEGLKKEYHEVKVAAMELSHFLRHLTDANLVITAGDRADIVIGSFVANRSVASRGLAGIVLTGGLRPDLKIRNMLTGLSDSALPILAVEDDTYQTATRVNAVRAWLTPDNERKIARALGVFESHVDVGELEDHIDLARPERVTPLMFEYQLIRRAAADRKTIVLPEGEEERVLRAADILTRRQVANIVLLGERDIIRRRISAMGLDLAGVEIIDPVASPLHQTFSETYFALRKHKGITAEIAADIMGDRSYFGTMMVHQGLADGMVSGAVNTTAHTIRPSFEFIRTRPGVSIVSSVFLMCLADRVLVYGDCAVNPSPSAAELADIAISAAATATQFGIEPRVAMLSYSTGESGTGDEVDRIREATRLVRSRSPGLLVEGPIQYDAAADATVARTKMPDSDVAGRATVYIFPDLNAGNNAYKAVQRSAGAVAIGPVLQGLNKPVNDLSRGCTVTDIVNTVAITAIQAQQETGG
jgi:phosphate acetyltransferase